MQLTINRDEANALLRALDRLHHELEFDMARIKLPRDRHSVVVFDDTLCRVRDRIALTAAEDQQPSDDAS